MHIARGTQTQEPTELCIPPPYGSFATALGKSQKEAPRPLVPPPLNGKHHYCVGVRVQRGGDVRSVGGEGGGGLQPIGRGYAKLRDRRTKQGGVMGGRAKKVMHSMSFPKGFGGNGVSPIVSGLGS